MNLVQYTNNECFINTVDADGLVSLHNNCHFADDIFLYGNFCPLPFQKEKKEDYGIDQSHSYGPH